MVHMCSMITNTIADTTTTYPIPAIKDNIRNCHGPPYLTIRPDSFECCAGHSWVIATWARSTLELCVLGEDGLTLVQGQEGSIALWGFGGEVTMRVTLQSYIRMTFPHGTWVSFSRS